MLFRVGDTIVVSSNAMPIILYESNGAAHDFDTQMGHLLPQQPNQLAKIVAGTHGHGFCPHPLYGQSAFHRRHIAFGYLLAQCSVVLAQRFDFSDEFLLTFRSVFQKESPSCKAYYLNPYSILRSTPILSPGSSENLFTMAWVILQAEARQGRKKRCCSDHVKDSSKPILVALEQTDQHAGAHDTPQVAAR